MSRYSRLSAPLPDSVMIRYYLEHPEEPVQPSDEHLRAAVQAARAERESPPDAHADADAD